MKEIHFRFFIVASYLAFSALLSITVYVGAAKAGHAHSTEHLNKHGGRQCKAADSSTLSGVQKCAKTMTSTFDVDGRLWSAWSNDDFLYVNYSDDKGTTFSQGVRVNAVSEKIAAGREHRPKIKISGNGVIYLSWTQKLKKRFTGNIRFSKSTDNGKSFSQPVTVNDNKEIISHRFDALGVNDRGDVYISWLDKRDKQQAKREGLKYNGAAAYYAVSTDKGQSFSKNIKLADNSCECCRMAMDFDTNDLPVIAWRHIYPENIRDHSIINFSARMKPNKPARLSHDNWQIDGCPHHGPSLSIDGSNRYHAVWFNNATINHGIFYANSSDAGKIFSPPVQVGRYENKASHADVLTVKGIVYILWQEYKDKAYQLYFMKSDNSGALWDKPILITASSRQPDSPFLLADKQKVYASWHIPNKRFKLMPLMGK